MSFLSRVKQVEKQNKNDALLVDGKKQDNKKKLPELLKHYLPARLLDSYSYDQFGEKRINLLVNVYSLDVYSLIDH